MKILSIFFIVTLFITLSAVFLFLYIVRFQNPYNRKCNKNRYLDLEKKRFFVDKLHVKDYINKNFNYIKTAKVYFKTSNLNELINYDFSKLPDKFVIKSNNASHDVLVVNDKKKLNKISRLITNNFKKVQFVFPHGNIPIFNNIIGYEKQYLIKKYYFIEEYLGEKIVDYKAHVINGKIKYIQVDTINEFDKCERVYDENFNLLDNKKILFKTCDFIHRKPKNLKLIKRFCYEFCKSNKLKFLRIDFYEIDGQLYFGEFTFTPSNCLNININL